MGHDAGYSYPTSEVITLQKKVRKLENEIDQLRREITTLTDEIDYVRNKFYDL